jgi:hypothetical protein
MRTRFTIVRGRGFTIGARCGEPLQGAARPQCDRLSRAGSLPKCTFGAVATPSIKIRCTSGARDRDALPKKMPADLRRKAFGRAIGGSF